MPQNQTDEFFAFLFLQSHNLQQQQQKLAPINTCLSNALNDDSKNSHRG